jgi:hypothetical protein
MQSLAIAGTEVVVIQFPLDQGLMQDQPIVVLFRSSRPGCAALLWINAEVIIRGTSADLDEGMQVCRFAGCSVFLLVTPGPAYSVQRTAYSVPHTPGPGPGTEEND